MTAAAIATAPAAEAAAPPRRRLAAWSAVLAIVVARSAVAFFGTLVVAALLPVVSRWDGYVVTSGSMEPGMSVGDVVLGQPIGDDGVEIGRVFIFADPGDPAGDRLLVHRVVDRREGGRWTTAGDANADVDVTPAPHSAFRSRAVVLVPLVGQPVVWWRERQLAPLLGCGVAAAVMLAVVLTMRPRSGSGGAGSGGTGSTSSRRAGGGRRGGRRRGPRRAGALGRIALAVPVAALAVGLTIALVMSPLLGTASSAFTATTRNPGNSWALTTPVQQPYNAAVLTDNPYFYYYLDEASGPALTDASGNNRSGTASSVASYRNPGALPNNPGYSVDLAGGGRIVSGGGALTNPTTFTLELWFRTSSTAGGKLVGFESGTGSGSTFYDRHVTVRTDGRLVYGDWLASPYRTLVSPAAYNDGAWHHLVLTAAPHSGSQLDAIMYVDGQVVASGATSRVSSYSGWWRVGAGRAGALGLTTPFPGRVDQVAVYRSVMTASRVAAHYAAR